MLVCGRQAVLNGGSGNDVLTARFGLGHTINGGSGDDENVGSNAADVISGGAGDDVIFARGGADTVTGGTGRDQVLGGGDDDEIIWRAGDGDDTSVDGGSGTGDRFSLFGSQGMDQVFFEAVRSGGGFDVVVNGVRLTGRGIFNVVGRSNCRSGLYFRVRKPPHFRI